MNIFKQKIFPISAISCNKPLFSKLFISEIFVIQKDFFFWREEVMFIRDVNIISVDHNVYCNITHQFFRQTGNIHSVERLT